MQTVEHELIKNLSNQIGFLTMARTELEIRLVQALQTVEALEKEVDRLGNGETTESDSE